MYRETCLWDILVLASKMLKPMKKFTLQQLCDIFVNCFPFMVNSIAAYFLSSPLINQSPFDLQMIPVTLRHCRQKVGCVHKILLPQLNGKPPQQAPNEAR